MSEVEFQAFEKLPRLSRGMVVTEKIDGTNAQVCITEDGDFLVGSRNRWITPDTDNFGFAKWAFDHEEELRTGLGIGRHFGEWWGAGIQRRYGLDEKRFSLFNTGRWNAENPPPECCHTVPVLYDGLFATEVVDDVLRGLYENGSVAAPGFMKPEGVIVYLSAARKSFKKTLDHNDEHKFMVSSDPREQTR